MNDSASISSSSYSNTSSNNSNSNSLNRSEQHSNATGLMLASNTQILNNISLINQSIASSLANSSYTKRTNKHFFSAARRRTKSQALFDGDDLNTMTEQNKQLIEDLYYLKKQLKEKDETINKLNDIRDKLESEIHELSASLFEQAYSMVNTAKAETAQAEKLLKEANGKIDVLQAEVSALKELVVATAPTSSTPNKHLHPYTSNPKTHKSVQHVRQSSWGQQTLNNLVKPQVSIDDSSLLNCTPSATAVTQQLESLSLPGHTTARIGKKEAKLLVKSHKRGASDVQPKSSFIEKLFHSSSSQQQFIQQKLQFEVEQGSQSKENSCYTSQANLNNENESQINQLYFKEIVEWRDHPELKTTSEFMKRVYKEDIIPCLSFNEKNVSKSLLESMESNSVCIEDLNISHLSSDSTNQICGLSNEECVCQYKIRLNEDESWILISRLTRNRVISVCDFLTYLRYIKDGLVKADVNEIYWNIIELRKKMSLSRLGL